MKSIAKKKTDVFTKAITQISAWWGVVAVLCIVAVTFSGIEKVQGQTVQDVIEYSHYPFITTTRSTSMGSSLGAVGADISSSATNPAGLGLYRRWDFYVGSSLDIMKSQSILFDREANQSVSGTTTNRLGFDFNCNALGAVFAFPTGLRDSSAVVRGFSLGFTMNRLTDFSRIASVSFTNNSHTMLDALADLGNRAGLLPEDLEREDAYNHYNAYLINAWQGFALDSLASTTPPDFGGFRSPFDADEIVTQTQTIRHGGSLDEFGLSFAMNFYDRIFFGTTLGISNLRHEWTKTHTIKTEEKINFGYTDGKIIENNKDLGAGVNLKLGLIGAVHENIRLGFALHTPTLLGVRSTQKITVKSNILLGDPPEKEADSKIKTGYLMATPLRLMGSFAGVFPWCIVNVDYHASFTPMARFLRIGDTEMGMIDPSSYEADNTYLQNHTVTTHQINAGVEFLVGFAAFRMGGGIMTSPYREVSEEMPISLLWHAGGGVGFALGKLCYLDLGLRYTPYRTKTFAVYDFNPESYEMEAYAKTKQSLWSVFTSFGVRIF